MKLHNNYYASEKLLILLMIGDSVFSFDQTPKVYPYDNLRVELGGEP